LKTAGRQLLKNVAGYDLTRLMSGSAGTLGFITDVTFRIQARPDRCAMITASGSMEACSEAASNILKSRLSPDLVVSMPDDQVLGSGREGRWLLMVGHEGFQETIEYLVHETGSLLDRSKLTVKEIRNYPLLEGHFKDVYQELDRFPFLLRADIPLDRLLRFVHMLNSHLRTGNTLVDLGLGRLLMGLDNMEDKFWSRISEQAGALGGQVLLEKAPQSFKKDQEVFGAPHPSWKIMRKIKKTLDPDDIFSPGCLPGRN